MHTHRLSALFALAVLGVSSAQSTPTVGDLLNRTQANLERSPWQATVLGQFKTEGGVQEAEVNLQVVPGSQRTLRLDFQKPAALANNFTVLTAQEAWTYLYVSGQLVIEPRATAKLNDLTAQLAGLGDVGRLTRTVNVRIAGEAASESGPAWRLIGTPRAAGERFASLEVLILKADPRPVRLTLKDAGGGVIGTLDLRNFRRAALTPQGLKTYPNDATVVRR